MVISWFLSNCFSQDFLDKYKEDAEALAPKKPPPKPKAQPKDDPPPKVGENVNNLIWTSIVNLIRINANLKQDVRS